MRDRFRDFSGGIYTNPRVRIAVDDGRSFVRRTPERYDVIQASLVDTWAATAAGAYTLTENTLYTVEAFNDYLDHLTDDGVLTITRWVFDGLRLVSLAQAACEARGWDAAIRLAIVQHDRVATFLLKKTPFTPRRDRAAARDRRSARTSRCCTRRSATAAPATPLGTPTSGSDGTPTGDYARLITRADRAAVLREYAQDIRPTTDDRPFFFHTTKLEDQFDVAFGRVDAVRQRPERAADAAGHLGGAGRAVRHRPAGRWPVAAARPRGWLAWLVYFGALGAGFMLIEVAVLQRFVLLLGHPVYSLTVTLFSLLLGTGIGAAMEPAASTTRRCGAVGAIALAASSRSLAIVVVVVVDAAGRRGRFRSRAPPDRDRRARCSCRSAWRSACRCRRHPAAAARGRRRW